MHRTPLKSMSAIVALAASVQAAGAAGNVSTSDAWVQLPMPGTTMTAAYVNVPNAGDVDDRLLSVSSRWAGSVEIHEMRTGDDGMMGMRELIYGVRIPAGETTGLTPSTTHLMLLNFRRRLVAGQNVPIQFHFLRAGTLTVSVPVRATGMPPASHHH
ncbi:MAG: copper chaperone PCu(A)C [Micropepsaceae bacterium]